MGGGSYHRVEGSVRGSEVDLVSVCGIRRVVEVAHRGGVSEVWHRLVDSSALHQCRTGLEILA